MYPAHISIAIGNNLYASQDTKLNAIINRIIIIAKDISLLNVLFSIKSTSFDFLAF